MRAAPAPRAPRFWPLFQPVTSVGVATGVLRTHSIVLNTPPPAPPRSFVTPTASRASPLSRASPRPETPREAAARVLRDAPRSRWSRGGLEGALAAMEKRSVPEAGPGTARPEAGPGTARTEPVVAGAPPPPALVQWSAAGAGAGDVAALLRSIRAQQLAPPTRPWSHSPTRPWSHSPTPGDAPRGEDGEDGGAWQARAVPPARPAGLVSRLSAGSLPRVLADTSNRCVFHPGRSGVDRLIERRWSRGGA